MYKNYIFDLYGTLVDIKTNEKKPYLWEKMAELFGFYGARYDKDELKKKYSYYCKTMEEERKKEEEYPEIDLGLVLKKLLNDKGVEEVDCSVIDSLQMSMRVISTKYIYLYDGVIELLEQLKAKDKKIYLLSNAQRGFTRPEIKYLDIEKYFDDILISSEEGCKKPGRSFYQRLLEKHNLNPRESIMIGNDSISDILGAHNMGMDSLYIHTAISPKCTEDLKSTYTIMDGDFKKIMKMLL